MQEEVWKDLPNYEGLYQVSNLGNVKSLSRFYKIQKNQLFEKKGKNLKPYLDEFGYLRVSISNKLIRKTMKVHQLVAMAFLNHVPDRTNKLVVDHINHNRLDNRVENLQIITNRENCSKDVKNKTSKYTGVSWNKNRKKWVAQIMTNNKKKV